MKKTLLPALALCLSVYAWANIQTRTVDVLRQLGIPELSAGDFVWNSLRGGYLSHPGRETLGKVPAAERATFVVRIGEYARSYARSEAFRAKYLEYRDSLKPTPPEPPKAMSQELQEQREELLKSIQEMEATLKTMPADQQAMMKEVIQTLKIQLQQLEDPANPLLSKEVENMQKESHAEAIEDYKRRLAEWEVEYPPGPEKMIRQRIEEFLEASRDVDFDAALVTGKEGRMIFANPDYERKPDKWKLCYRAGRQTVEAARAFARQWLEELEKAK